MLLLGVKRRKGRPQARIAHKSTPNAHRQAGLRIARASALILGAVHPVRLFALPAVIARCIFSFLDAKSHLTAADCCKGLCELSSHAAAWPPDVALIGLDVEWLNKGLLSYLRPRSLRIQIESRLSLLTDFSFGRCRITLSSLPARPSSIVCARRVAAGHDLSDAIGAARAGAIRPGRAGPPGARSPRGFGGALGHDH